MPNTATTQVLARATFDRVKRGERLADAEAQQLNSYLHIDALRDLVAESDVDALLRRAREESGPNRDLLISLLQRFDQSPNVKAYLRAEWARGSTLEHRMPLVWRLLDDPEIDTDLRAEVVEFVLDHLDTFAQASAAWCGGTEAILPATEARLRDERFPRAKAWVYLCAVTSSPDRRGLVELLERYSSNQDQLTASVASRLLSRMRHGRADEV